LHHGEDELVLRFLAQTLHPVVGPYENEVAQLLKSFNEALRGTAASSTRLIGIVAMPFTDGVVGSPFMAQPLNFGSANVNIWAIPRCS
jgi:hypothetical protein